MTEVAITVLLDAARQGDASATGKLFSAVYDEMRKLAHHHRRQWMGNETINTTALINEAFIKLAGRDECSWTNRTHFYATASRAMRHILVSYALQQKAGKRGGEALRVDLDDLELAAEMPPDELLDFDNMLKELGHESARRCHVVECRVFGGMTVEETAAALDTSPATVKREWQLASIWLYQRAQDEKGNQT